MPGVRCGLVSSNDPLLQPFQLGHLTLKNRIFSSSHAPGYNTDGTPNERYIAYHEEKAKGGIGMTMIGGSSNVSPWVSRFSDYRANLG